MLWTTRCIPLKCPWRQNLERRTFWTRYLCCNPNKNVWNRAKMAENTIFRILSIFSVFANPVCTSTRSQTSSLDCDIIIGLFGSHLTKETLILPKKRRGTAGTSSTQKCLFWGILANLVHNGSRLNINFQPKWVWFSESAPKKCPKTTCPGQSVEYVPPYW